MEAGNVVNTVQYQMENYKRKIAGLEAKAN